MDFLAYVLAVAVLIAPLGWLSGSAFALYGAAVTGGLLGQVVEAHRPEA